MTPLALLAPVLAFAAVSLHDAVRHPTLRRLAVRNVLRRRGEAILIVTGCLLGAAIITSALLVGDSLRASVRDAARTELGPVDEVVRLPPARLGAAAALAQALPAGAEALAARRAPAVIVAGGRGTPRAEPDARLVELDFAAARRLGRDASITGFAGAGATPAPGELVVGRDVARRLRVGAGDRVAVLAAGGRTTLRVRSVVPALGIAGLRDDAFTRVADVFAAPGTLRRLAAGGSGGARPPEGLLLVANGGGVFGGVGRTAEVTRALEDRLSGLGAVSVEPVKRDLLEAADAAGRSFTEIFAAIGAVAVIAGVLLLVNVFVMLAEERKPQLGTMRALGMRRNHVVRAFGIEGGLYAVAGAALGALAGIGVGRIVVEVAARIFAGSGEDLDLRFAVPAGSVVSGFALGAGISCLTVWITSARIARLNVIRAIRDQPAPPRRGGDGRGRAAGLAGLALGVLVTAAGVVGDAWAAALLGPVLAAAALVALLAGRLGARRAASGAALGVLLWSLVCFSALPGAFDTAGVTGFVAQGVVMTAAAICLVSLHSGWWSRAAGRLGSGRSGLAARLGLAYPLARPGRTAMQMGMFALVVFSLVFLATLSHLYGAQAPRYVRDVGAGYQVVLDTSPGHPAAAAQLAGLPGVAGAAPLVRATPEFSAPRHRDLDPWFLTGFDRRLLARGSPALADRDPRYASDRAAFLAVLRSPGRAIVPEWFLQTGGGTPQQVVRPGESLVIRNPATGAVRRLRVVGLLGADWARTGVMVSAGFARSFLGRDAVASRALLALGPGGDPDAVAAALDRRLVERGADAESIRAVVDRGLGVSQSFLALSQGYIALGLVIGIGGLGVVMVRAVRERRREVGMLRAMGVPSALVRGAFLAESAFVAARGLLIGAGLSLLSCWLLVTRSDALGADRFAFSAPWGALAGLLALTLVAAVACTLVPAERASRIRPAAALRVAD